MTKIIVPATSANLGPGFDTLGLALNLYNKFSFEETLEGIEINGCTDQDKNEKNLVYISLLRTFELLGYKGKGIKIDIEGDIPMSSGLGSSASCILGGIMGADELLGASLSKEEILKLGTEIEGHPDNIAPALFGGLVVSLMEDNNIYYNQINMAKGIKFIGIVPDFTLSTSAAREVLPGQVPYREAIENVSRVSLLISAIANGRFDLLKYALKDNLHQPYRGKLIPKFNEIVEKSYEIGALGTYLSGAGPTIMSIIKDDNKEFIVELKEYLNQINYKSNVLELEIDFKGARATKN